MRFYADLHVHSRYSRATSGDCDLFHLSYWARRKGIAVLGTGDFTHPAWMQELREQLVPAEPGLYRLREDLERQVDARLEAPCRGPTRFLLSVEISTIYKKGDRTRKVHHLIYAPDFEAADRLTRALSKVGNLGADGRPILGLDSRHLLEAVLESGEGSYLVPAHIWTPWFSVLGSKAGFDAVEECYGDLSGHIFALETGLSSDPAMNWRVSALDRYRLVSSSDAHSPPKLGREATMFETALDYFAIRRALETGEGFGGTLEFFPEEGKYHLDGHRNCNVVLEPAETRARGEACPVCGHPVTVGVLHRVEELADRKDGARPEGASNFKNLVPLPEVLGELHGRSADSKGVQRSYEGLLARLGPELFILEEAPVEAIARAGVPLLGEAVARMRAGQVIRQAGYDGEYGVIRLFEREELRRSVGVGLLFGEEAAGATGGPRAGAAGEGRAAVAPEGGGPAPERRRSRREGGSGGGGTGGSQAALFEAPGAGGAAATIQGTAEPAASTSAVLSGLDPDQRAAAGVTSGPLLIIAGPGTGKTRTLTHRIAHLVLDHGVAPEACLAITFTRRAAEELRERLGALLGEAGARVPALTFHALGLSLLQEHAALVARLRGQEPAGEAPALTIAGERERAALLVEALGIPERRATRLLAEISRRKRRQSHPADRSGAAPEAGEPELAVHPDPAEEAAEEVEVDAIDHAWRAYEEALAARGLCDLDDLVGLAVDLLEAHPEVLAGLRERYRHVSIDEYQDIDERQYRLVRALVPPGGEICAIGDPDQAIYGFRGAEVGFFFRFQEDFPSAQVVRLRRNYRSTRAIVDAALQVIAPSPTLGARELLALFEDERRISIEEAPSERAEAELVVHTIERMMGGSTFFSMDSGRVGSAERDADLAFSDFAILYRTEAQADALREALARSGMPFQRRSHRHMVDRPAAEAIAHALRAARSTRPVADQLKELAETLGLSEDQVSAALEILMPLARRCGEDVARFLLELGTEVEVDAWDPRAQRISLLTLHASKGLEFRVVFMVGCEDGLVPLRLGGSEATSLDEERRLFYVGMTRARERLLLTWTRERLRRGQVTRSELSPFVREIEEALLERRKAEARRRAPDPATRQLKLF